MLSIVRNGTVYGRCTVTHGGTAARCTEGQAAREATVYGGCAGRCTAGVPEGVRRVYRTVYGRCPGYYVPYGTTYLIKA